jgi:hypothetical protein
MFSGFSTGPIPAVDPAVLLITRAAVGDQFLRVENRVLWAKNIYSAAFSSGEERSLSIALSSKVIGLFSSLLPAKRMGPG